MDNNTLNMTEMSDTAKRYYIENEHQRGEKFAVSFWPLHSSQNRIFTIFFNETKFDNLTDFPKVDSSGHFLSEKSRNSKF